MGWLFLGLAIIMELFGTVSMKLSESFSRVVPSVLLFVFYGVSFTSLNFALGYMEVSVVYAIWSGVGIVLVALAGFFIFEERLSSASVVWIGVIVIGVIGLSASHRGH
ncbi:DMT family transporter [Cohnella hongkongensis]|uniref:DMT family transporter n=1 Tax=Cohnella hongkongensis TaxID=178337 RepID=A0ABV9F812_9BACL